MVQPTRLENKRSRSPLRLCLSTMLPIYCEKPALRRPALGFAAPGPEPFPGLELALAVPSNNNLFQEFMRT